MSAPLRIGLTGGIGSGKTTACNLFSQLGVPIIDADEIAHDLVTVGKPALKAILKEFGEELLTEEGDLDRPRLRQKIFNNPLAKEKLESILHPLVYKEIEQAIQAVSSDYCIVSIPLLLETRSVDRFDRILVIDAPETLQLERASQRDRTDPRHIQSIIDKQISRTERLRSADDIIQNDGDMASLEKQIQQIHKKYLTIASTKHKKIKSD